MKLKVLERVHLLGILPTEGNFVTLKIVRQLRESLSFSEDEIAALGIRQDGEIVTWNAASEDHGGTEVQIGEKATDIIIDALRALDRESKLNDALLDVYEKFIPYRWEA